MFYISALLPDAVDKNIKVKISTKVQQKADINNLIKVLQDIMYLRPLYEAQKLPDKTWRERLEKIFHFMRGNRCLCVREECCEIILFCPTQEAKSLLMLPETRKDIEECISDISVEAGGPRVEVEVIEYGQEEEEEEGEEEEEEEEEEKEEQEARSGLCDLSYLHKYCSYFKIVL